MLFWRKKKVETKETPVEEKGEEVEILESYKIDDLVSVRIVAGTPPRYEVIEPELTAGERELIKEIKTRLYEVIDAEPDEIADRESYLRDCVQKILKDFRINIKNERFEKLMYYIYRDLLRYDKLDVFLRDPTIEDISVDGPNVPVYIYHRKYGSMPTNVQFDSEELDALIYKLAQRAGKHISLANPLLDASLPTKDRLQLTLGSEVTARGSTITIRRFREIPLSPIDLINYGTYSVEMMAYMWMAVENGSNIMIAGGTATGKTSTLNAIAMFIPPESKIVTIEDTREINLLHENWIPAVTREGGEGRKEIDMFELLKTALRQRPEYIIVGEIRGREAYTLFQAMATGHATLSTIHADSTDAVVRRLTKPPIDVPIVLLDNIDVLCIQRLVKVGAGRFRRCIQIIEVLDVDFETESLRTNELFRWRAADDKFEFSGESMVFSEIMEKMNIDEDELSEEFNRRVKILEWMRKKNITEFRDIAKILFMYTRDPDKIMEVVESG
uniref:Secretion system protein E n=1 Tax=Geoglobus ahangari TaxID=113653 RepID=A0A7C4S6L0_9EURY